MDSLSKNKDILIAIGILIGSIFICRISHFIISQKVKECQSYIEQMQEKKKVISRLSETEKVISKKIEKFKIPESLSLVNIITNIDNRLPSLSISSIHPLSAKDKEFYEELPLKINFVCDYISFIQFLKDLERLNKVLNIDEINISKEPDTSRIKVSLSLKGINIKKK